MSGSKCFDPEFGCGEIVLEVRPDTVPPEIISFPIAPGKKDVLRGLIMVGKVLQVKKNQRLSSCGMIGFWDGRPSKTGPFFPGFFDMGALQNALSGDCGRIGIRLYRFNPGI